MNYTRIQARVTDQAIQLVNVPLIASGGLNEVRVDFTFCPKWANLGKTAVFYQDPKQAYHALLVDDSAVVPAEVLAKDGLFYFGVFGDGEDQVRTTEVVSMTVVKGAITFKSIEPGEPTPDIYQQLLAAYGDLVSANGKAAVIRVKDTNGGRDVTFWVGTQDQYDALDHEELNCIYIITDAPMTTITHEFNNDGTSVRWYSDGFAECWVNYAIQDITTPYEFGGLYLSGRYDLPLPDVFKNTHYYVGAPILCETILQGMAEDDTSPLVLFSGGSSDNYVTNARVYIGTTRQITEEKVVKVRLHLVWRYKREEAEA